MNVLLLLVLKRNKKYKSNHNVVYHCVYHVIWCPKYRRAVLIGQIETRLNEIITTTCQELRSDMLELEVMPDLVHLLVECDPQFGINQLVKRLKGRSSRLLRQEFSELTTKMPTLWTNSSFVCTVGGAPLAVIKRYIANQKYT